LRIAVFTKNRSNPAYEAARLGADRAARLLGARTAHYVPEAFDDPVQQSALVDQALAARHDGIVFTPTPPPRVNAALRRIAAAGVPLAGFVNPIPAGPCVTYAGSDDSALGRAIATRLFSAIGGKGRVLFVAGPAESVTGIERIAAFGAAAAAFPDIEVAGVVHGDYRHDTARERVRGWLGENRAVRGIAAANDVMALGALDALDDSGLRATVVGVNAIPDAIAAIRAGRLLATADFNAMRMCYLATEGLIRHLRGESVPARVMLPVEIVDASNADRWNLPYAERPIPTLAETLA
jgi:ribose transport system substrate-binding protein